jgi:biotin carboxyl carrier protein
MNYEFRIGDTTYSMSLKRSEKGYDLSVGDKSLVLAVRKIGENVFMLTADGVNRVLHVAGHNGKTYVHLDGRVILVEDVLAEQDAATAAQDVVDGLQKVVAPMPGKLVKLAVSEGEKVTKGMTVCIIEAMKMENVIQAKLDGIVRNVSCEVGILVDTDMPIMEIVAEE